MSKIKIQTHRIQRTKGRVVSWGTLKLIKVHKDAINNIGKGANSLSIQEYFDQHISTHKVSYKVETIWDDIPDERDQLLIIEVTV